MVGAALSSTPGIPVPPIGTVPLALDALFLLSTSGALPTVFTNFAGLLDAFGEATATLNFPAVPALAGYAYLGSRIDQVRLQIVDIVQRVTFAAGRARGA